MTEQLAAYYAQNEGKRLLQAQFEPASQDWTPDTQEQTTQNNSQTSAEESSGLARLQRWFSNLTQPKQA